MKCYSLKKQIEPVYFDLSICTM